MESVKNLNEQGFTVIEVLIATTIFAVGLLAVATMMISSIRTNSQAALITEGVSRAHNKVEELLSLDYAASVLVDANDNGSAGLEDTTSPAADSSELLGNYNLYWNVANDIPVVDAKTIRVITTWNDRGSLKRYSLDVIKERE